MRALARRGVLAALVLLPASLCRGGERPRAAEGDADDSRRLRETAGISREALEGLARQYTSSGFTREDLAGAPEEAERLLGQVDLPRAKLDRLAKRLALISGDGDAAEIERLLAERLQVREELNAVIVRMNELLPKLDALHKGHQVAMWSKVLAGKTEPMEVKNESAARDLFKRVKGASRQAGHEYVQEEVAFRLLLERLEARRESERRWGGLKPGHLGLAGLAAVLGALLVLLWRTQLKLAQATQRLTQPGAARPGEAGLLAGNYRLGPELGRGAMGVVYEALDTALQRRVAIKKLREELRRSPRDLEQFLSEARLVAQLRHPHIVEIFAVLQEAGEVYLVFERVEGRTLDDRLGAGRPLAPPEALALAAQVGSALDFAHERRVVHRDLKPANIMVAPDGRAKVMDFGIAHQVSRTVARATSAQSWGTPPYMAPEAELGKVSKAGDLYSLAVCVYEMLTARLPFDGPNYLAQKRERAFAPPSSLAPGLPAAADGVLARALDPEAARRFASAAELVAALRAALAQASA